jgi:hypothetical protein
MQWTGTRENLIPSVEAIILHPGHYILERLTPDDIELANASLVALEAVGHDHKHK